MDLHSAFADPAVTAPAALSAFLLAVDREPGIRAARDALLQVAPPVDGGLLVDAGCGLGLETARLAAEHPDAGVLGLDRDPALLAAARQRAEPGATAPSWVRGDVRALPLADRSVAVLRTERVLMYVPEMAGALREAARVLRPGGTLACFELDYSTIELAPGGLGPGALAAVRDCLRAALPQPAAGRNVAQLAAAAGLVVRSTISYPVPVGRPVWQRIVAGTLTAAIDDGRLADPAVLDWVRELDQDGFTGVRTAFTGLLTVAHR